MPEKSTPSERMREFLRAKETKQKFEEALKYLQESRKQVPRSREGLASLG